MSIVSEIKCQKCDRMYSGVRSKCTYCGARRISAGKYSAGGDNSKGKILIAVLIMSVFVAATGVLLFTTEGDELPDDPQMSNGEAGLENENGNGLEDGLVTEPGLNPVLPEPEEEEEDLEEEFPEMPIVATSVSVMFNNAPVGQVGEQGREFTTSVGEALNLTVRVEPLGVEDEIEWDSSDRAVFEITPSNPEQTAATFRAVGTGTARLTVTVGDISQSVIVRVPR